MNVKTTKIFIHDWLKQLKFGDVNVKVAKSFKHDWLKELKFDI